MGSSPSKLQSPKPNAEHHVDATTSDTNITNLALEIERWERIYRERFARGFIFSSGTRAPLWSMLSKPYIMPDPWKFGPPSECRRFQRTNPRYAGPTPEPISAELAAMTRRELVRSYHTQIMFGSLAPYVRWKWSPTMALGDTQVPYLSHGDALPLELQDGNLIQHSWLNQTIAVYFEPDFMRCHLGKLLDEGHELDVYWGHGCGYIARALLAAWLDVHHNNGEIPNFQQSRYFAKPFILKGWPNLHGATEATIYTHKIICEELRSAQNKPVSPEDLYTWVEHGCEMGPIYRSVIIIVDKQLALRGSRDPVEQRDILFEQCSVLLVRTGDEDHLSAPVDLSALSAAGLDLPLDRSEDALAGANNRQQVVRVRIRTAVRFIMDLERRERDASARLTAMKKVLDVETFREADAWASAVLAHAEKNGGIDQDRDAWPAVRLAQAHLDGDRCGLEDPPFEKMHPLRTWFYEYAECYKDDWVSL